MKNTARVVVAALIVGVAFSSASAVTINMQLGWLYKDAAANQKLDVGSTCLLVADADHSGWDDYTNIVGPKEGQTLLGPDSFVAEGDVVLASFALNGKIQGNGTHEGDAGNWDNSQKGVAVGDEMALLWFDIPHTDEIDEDSGPVGEVRYGFYRTDSVLSGSDQAYVVPDNNVSGWINSFTAATGGGDIAETGMAAPYVTPEPFTMGVLAIGGLAMLRRRRVA